MFSSRPSISSNETKSYTTTCNVIKCQMTLTEKDQYKSILLSNRKKDEKKCEIQKVFEHPYLIKDQHPKLFSLNISELIDSSGKMIALNELFEDSTRKHRRIIIISKINDIIKILDIYLKSKNYEYMIFNNTIRGKERQDIITKFNSNDLDFCVLLMCSDEFLTGINLSFADCIIFYDNEVNKEKIIQNLNIKNSAIIYQLFMDDQIDENTNSCEIINLTISQSEHAQKDQLVDFETINVKELDEIKSPLQTLQIPFINLNDDNPKFPLQINDNLHILSIGKIVTKDKFHTNKFIYPAGYCAKRLLPSVKNLNEDAWYFFKIIDNGGPDPIFRIEMESDSSINFEDILPSKVCFKFIQNIKANEKILLSGPELFGLTVSIVQFIIQNLDGVDKLNNYIMKKFVMQNEKSMNKNSPSTKSPKKLRFQTGGACQRDRHYMVNINDRLEEIKNKFINEGKYFVINRSKQCGKTTTLFELIRYLKSDYYVFYVDLENLDNADFESETKFMKEFLNQFLLSYNLDNDEPDLNLIKPLEQLQKEDVLSFKNFFTTINDICKISRKPLVMIIDEFDVIISNVKVFINFLSLSRGQYQRSDRIPTFKSIILSGVNYIDKLRSMIRPEEASNILNSPWNIAADFDIDMSFSISMISSMLKQYDDINKTGMDIPTISRYIYEYTSGQPFLVSKICQIIDEELPINSPNQENKNYWSREGIVDAVNIILNRRIPFFVSLFEMLDKFPNMEKLLETIILKNNQNLSQSTYYEITSDAQMYGLIKIVDGNLSIPNRILEMALTYHFITKNNMKYLHGDDLNDRSKYIKDNQLENSSFLVSSSSS